MITSIQLKNNFERTNFQDNNVLVIDQGEKMEDRFLMVVVRQDYYADVYIGGEFVKTSTCPTAVKAIILLNI